jgi:hypothetical protein
LIDIEITAILKQIERLSIRFHQNNRVVIYLCAREHTIFELIYEDDRASVRETLGVNDPCDPVNNLHFRPP